MKTKRQEKSSPGPPILSRQAQGGLFILIAIVCVIGAITMFAIAASQQNFEPTATVTVTMTNTPAPTEEAPMNLIDALDPNK